MELARRWIEGGMTAGSPDRAARTWCVYGDAGRTLAPLGAPDGEQVHALRGVRGRHGHRRRAGAPATPAGGARLRAALAQRSSDPA